jgi:hypothetical protein
LFYLTLQKYRQVAYGQKEAFRAKIAEYGTGK